MLACYANEEQESWDMYLDFVTFAYNTSQHSSIDSCPFYLFFKRNPIIPNDIAITQDVQVFEDNDEYERQWKKALEYSREKLGKAQVKQKQLYDQGSKVIEFKTDNHVLLKAHATAGKFSNRWLGPFKITRKLSDLNYEIVTLNNTPEAKYIVHVNRLKLVTDTPNKVTPSDDKPILAKRRGRPSKVIQTEVEAEVKHKVGRPRTKRTNQVKIRSVEGDHRKFHKTTLIIIFSEPQRDTYKTPA